MSTLKPLLSICVLLLASSTAFAQIGPVIIFEGSSDSGLLGTPDIVGKTVETAPNITTTAQRKGAAKNDAYNQYLVLCVTRALLGLPVPTISHENYFEYTLPDLNGFGIVTGEYEMWLDDPLEVFDSEPGPPPTPSP